MPTRLVSTAFLITLSVFCLGLPAQQPGGPDMSRCQTRGSDPETVQRACISGPAPRTPEGTPDLTGIWQRENGLFGFDVVGEESPSEGWLEPAMSPWAEKRYRANRRGANPAPARALSDTGLDPSQHPYCLPQGFPRNYDNPHPFEIVQLPKRVYMLFETNNQARRIYLDGREHPEGVPATFMGHSVGKWDAETLTVETVGLNDLTWIDYLGRPHTDALRVQERIRRVNHDTIQIDLTFEDPETYMKPWTGRMVFYLQPEWEIMENVLCEDRSGEAFRKAVDSEDNR